MPLNDTSNPLPKPTSGELIAAAAKGDMAAVKDLLLRGADPDEKNTNGETALMYATGLHSNIEALRLLLDKGADPDIKCVFRYNALHLAVNFGRPDFVRLLLDHGADYNAENADGKTPMALAVEKDNAEIIGILQGAVEHRAEKKAKAEADEKEKLRHAEVVLKQQMLRDQLRNRFRPKF